MIARRISSLRHKIRMPAFVERRHVRAARARIHGHRRGHLHVAGKKQLLVDISTLSKHDAGTGIQRVVRAVLTHLLAEPPAGYVVRPVAATRKEPYRHVAWGKNGADSDPGKAIKINPGDLFLGLDLSAHVIPSHYRQLADWKRQGAILQFLVYDLLPLQHPEWFPTKLVSSFRRWIRAIAMLADSAICISRIVEKDLVNWMHERYALAPGKLQTRVIPLGWDIASTQPSTGLPHDFEQILAHIRKNKTALMVGTLEPRKGHAQILEAFEQLWLNGEDYNLAIVGRPGWNTDALQAKLRNHPERNRRLFWLDNASDEALQALYRTCDGVIAASYGEGFGLTIVEAIGHGKPVLARDLPIFRDVAGESVQYFSTNSGRDVVSEISFFLNGARGESGEVMLTTAVTSWRDSVISLVDGLDSNRQMRRGTEMQNLDRAIEVEVIHNLGFQQELTFKGHFFEDELVYIDNIHGGFDKCPLPASRESGIGQRYSTWVRARWVIYALLDSLRLSPILAYLGNCKHISGFGVSDDVRYAEVLANVFDYRNSFYHQEPKLDVMELNRAWGLGKYDFIVCSDVLEHTFGDWRAALRNLGAYLKPGGVLILTVPWSADLQETEEHYAGCVDYDVIFENGEFKEVVIHLGDGASYVAESPYFHGGPGNTLEMRNFSRSQLIEEGLRQGFTSVKEYSESIPRFGIVVEDTVPGILAFTK